MLLVAVTWGREDGLGETEAQRGLVSARVTHPAGVESGFGPGLHPLPMNPRGDKQAGGSH